MTLGACSLCGRATATSATESRLDVENMIMAELRVVLSSDTS